MDKNFNFWAKSVEELTRELGSSDAGLSSAEAGKRLANINRRQKRFTLPPGLKLLFSQYNNFITLILLFSAVMSILLSDTTNGIIILCILILTGLLSFWQEHGAKQAVDKLTAMVRVTTKIMRDGTLVEVAAETVVPGDVVVLSAGDIVPGDSLVLEAKDFFADESVLTGETFPVEKQPGIVPPETALAQRLNTLYFGTHVVSGKGRVMIAAAGADTQFGAIKKRLNEQTRLTSFQQGIISFSAFLAKVTLSLVLAIFFLNVFFDRPILDSFMFSLALAVGLTPQLLPAIVGMNLAYGARKMALKQVIVRRLASIENFGSMDILCSDKTGTLTSGKIKLKDALNADGSSIKQTLDYAFVNASFQTGFVNPLDAAVRDAAKQGGISIDGWERLDEVPYDFIRKRISIMAKSPEGKRVCVTKGAYPQIISICAYVESGTEVRELTDDLRKKLDRQFAKFGESGNRTIAVATKEMGAATVLTKNDETAMTFRGFLVFEDPIKEDADDVTQGLGKIGVKLKIITGDNANVAKAIAEQAGFKNPRIATGNEIRNHGMLSLSALAEETDVFAEVEPNQKESIILAFRKRGHIVGYLGDGINDIPALNAADVGISVDSAVGAAKQAADMILLEKDLSVLLEGVNTGRRVFANTMKYIFMATSANFGNMFSMACVAVWLPFLPLLPKQILLTNLLTDLPEMAMPSDNVDPESIRRPRTWDINFIRGFMIRFGILSSVFDLITFYVLMRIMKGDAAFVRTGWFVESAVSAIFAVLLVRTRKPFFQSRPHKILAAACTAGVAAAISLPYTVIGRDLFNFVKLPPSFLAVVAVIVTAYMLSIELVKYFFFPSGRRKKQPKEKPTGTSG